MTEPLTPEQATEIIIILKDTVKMLTDEFVILKERVDRLEGEPMEYVG